MVSVLDNFVGYLANDKKVSANTLQSYKRDISQYLEYLKSAGIGDCTSVTPTAYINYMAHLRRIGKAPTTVSRAIASTRAFYRYLCSHNMCRQNPADKVHSLKAEKKLPQILTGEEVSLLLAQPSDGDLKGLRDIAMLELLYATGIRVTELVSLNVGDVNLEVGYIICRKQLKERIIPIYPRAVKALRSYIDEARPLLAEEEPDALFVNTNGSRLTRQGFWKIVKQYQHKAKIDKDITPHTLRHSFAAHLLENGADIKSLQEMLGHADVSSTQVYTNMLKNKIKEVYKNAHPMANCK